MTARRQSSATSLQNYARSSSPMLNSSMDYCNSFWGPEDSGVAVLFARMRGAMRTIEELNKFWKMRFALEDEYAKGLAKLAKNVLGRDEIGELRNCLDTIRLETDRQASFHANLANTIKTELEGGTTTFYQRQIQMKTGLQNAVEKEYKVKQQQEKYVNQAREKYEQDCMRINSYTAQSTLVQGKELDKIQLKLFRTQQTVGQNEKDFANFAKSYKETAAKWEVIWKEYCDRCQDMEEARVDFLRDNLWAYANAVSAGCVADDESCEKVRVTLEGMETEREMENFVRLYGTGNQIPDAPTFVNYASPDAIPSVSEKRSFHPARFARESYKDQRGASQPPPPRAIEDVSPETNAAGVGAGGSSSRRGSEAGGVTLVRQPSRKSTVHSVAPSNAPTAAQQYRNSYLEDASAPTSAADSDVSHLQEVGWGNNHSSSTSASPSKDVYDPLAKQLEDLQNTVSVSGSTRRNSMWRQSVNVNGGEAGPSRRNTLDPSTFNQGSANSTRSSSTSPGPPPPHDYRNSAEIVVGAHPAASSMPTSTSRPASPNPGAPTAAFMVPRKPVSPSGSEIIEGVVADYAQSLPGERKALSRRGSYVAPADSNSPSNPAPAHSLSRPQSVVGHPGIGAHGSRSASPQPLSRSASPVRGVSPIPPNGMISASSQPHNLALGRPASPGQRAVSPNNVGIALDPNGRVMHDEMAQRYQQQQQQQQMQIHQQRIVQQQQQPRPQSTVYQQPPQQRPPSAAHQQSYGGQPAQRRTSYMAVTPAPAQPAYAPTPTPDPAMHVPPPPPLHSYGAPAHPGYGAPTPAPAPAAYPVQQHQHVIPSQSQPSYIHQQPQQQALAGRYTPAVQQPPPATNGYYVNGHVNVPVQQQPPQHNQPVRHGHNQQQSSLGFRQGQSAMYQHNSNRSPSPLGPVGTTDQGEPILFYVKALYDYQATIEEEFDFQAGDIIAVTATPDDGWWSGQLLDDTRRQRGKHIFPSNFVCLF